MGEDVIIIGGGIAGLTIAHELSQAGWRVRLLEAQERLGGRIWTKTGHDGLPIELGAEFLHGEKGATWSLVRAAGLTTCEVPSRHWHTASGGLREDDAFSEALQKATRGLERLAPDCSFQEFLDQAQDLKDLDRWLLREYVEGFHAAEAKRMSALAFAQSERAADEVTGTRQFRLKEGYGALINWLESEVRRRGVQMHLGCRVRQIRWKPGLVQVFAETTRGVEQFPGARAIVTVPISALKFPGRAHVEFEPPLEGKASVAWEKLEMGDVTKVILRFGSRFWPVENFGFIHSNDEWLPTWWAEERGPILTGWAGGPRAYRMSPWSEELLHSQAIRSLCGVFSVAPGVVANALQTFHFHNWSQDPFSRGAYSYARMGASGASAELAEPVQGTNFFAGEAAAPPGQLGTVHGAVASAQRTARLLIQGP
jgi:monoamine oxidase